ncbi:MAG: MBG domain-containing protein [Christensenellaceae bacterium]|nr:MBG domain-containing protein [Christensenellaceae bacterium]
MSLTLIFALFSTNTNNHAYAAGEYPQGVVNQLVNTANTTVLYGPNGSPYKNIFPSDDILKYDTSIFHSADNTNDSEYAKFGIFNDMIYKSENTERNYIIFDFKQFSWVSKFVFIAREWQVQSGLLNFSIWAAPTLQNIDMTTKDTADVFVKNPRNRNGFTKIAESIESMRPGVSDGGVSNSFLSNPQDYIDATRSGSRNNAPKTLIFDPVYTRYIMLSIDRTWRINGSTHYLEIGEIGWYYTTPLAANATDSEKEVYDIYNYYNTSGGNAQKDTLDASYYGYGGYSNYTIVYAPKGYSDSDKGDSSVDKINDGIIEAGNDNNPFYHSSYNGNTSSNSVYGTNAPGAGGNITGWVTNPQNDAYIIVDLGTTRLVSGITFWTRKSNGRVTKFDVYINKNHLEYPDAYISGFVEGDSRARGVTSVNNQYFTRIAQSSQNLSMDNLQRSLTFDRIYSARYVVLVPTETYNTEEKADMFISIFELQIDSPSEQISLVDSEQSFWENVGSSGIHSNKVMLTKDITITGNAFNYNGSNLDQSAFNNNATRLSYERNAVDTSPTSGSDDGNWFTGSLLGSYHTITYDPIVSAPSANNSVNVRVAGAGEDLYFGFITAHLRGGTLRDFNFVLSKIVYLTSYSTSTDTSRHGYVVGSLVGIMDFGSIINNVNITISNNAGIVAAGNLDATSGTGQQSWVVGGIVGRLRTSGLGTTPNIISNCKLTMGDNSILSADGEDGGGNPSTLLRTGGAGIVGGFVGLVATYNDTESNNITNCQLVSSTTSIIHAANRIYSGSTSYQAAGVILGSVQGASNKSLAVDINGFIADFKGMLIVYDDKKPVAPSGSINSGNYSAGIIAGHYYAAKATLTVKNLFVSTNAETKIATSQYNNPCYLTLIKNYNYTTFSTNSTPVTQIASTTTINASTSNNPWVGVFTSNDWYNSNNIVRFDVGIYTGSSLSTNSSVVYNSISKSGLVQMTYKTDPTNKYLSGYVIGNTTTFLYESKLTTYDYEFTTENLTASNKIPKMYDLYYTTAKLITLPSNETSKIYDGTGFTYAIVPSASFGGITESDAASYFNLQNYTIVESIYSGSTYSVDKTHNLSTNNNLPSTTNASKYTSQSSDVNKYKITATNSGSSEFISLNFNNTLIPSHALIQTPNASFVIELEIKQKTLKVVFSDLNCTYNGSSQTPTAIVSTGISGQEFSVNLTGVPKTDVGDYEVIASSLSSKGTAKASNYTIDNSNNAHKATFVISAKPLTLIFSNNTFDYDGTLRTVTASVSGLVGNQTLAVNLSDNTRTNSGNQTVNFQSLSDGTNGGLAKNYTVTGTSSTTLTINEIQIVLSPKPNLTKVYDGSNISITYADINYTGNISGEIPSFSGSFDFTPSSGNSRKNAGTYTYTQGDLSIQNSGNFNTANYNIAFDLDGFTYIITQRPIEVVVYNGYTNQTATKVYDGTTSTSYDFIRNTHYAIKGIDYPGENTTISEAIKKEITGINYSKAYNSKDVNSANTITLTFGALKTTDIYNANNYSYSQGTTLDYNKDLNNFTAKISQATIQVTPLSSLSKYYYENDPVLSNSYQFDTPVESETPAFSGGISRNPGEDVGLYDLIVNNLVLADNGNFSKLNYTMYFTTGVQFIISPRILTIIPNTDQTKIYGDDDPSITYSVQGASALGSYFSGALSRDAGADVNSYNITIGSLGLADNGEFLASNHQISFTEGVKFTINARILEVKPNNTNITKVYGEDDPATLLEFNYSNNIHGETPAFDGSLSRVQGENVGNYNLTTGNLKLKDNGNFKSNNYSLNIVLIDSNEDIILEITKKQLILSLSSYSQSIDKEYDGNTQAPARDYSGNEYSIVVIGLAFNQTVILTPISAVYNSKDVETANILTFTYNNDSYSFGNGGSQDNYQLQYALQLNGSIIAKTLYVTTDSNLSKTYGDADPTFTYKYSSNLENETPKFNGALSRDSGVDVSTYNITLGSLEILDDVEFIASNYQISFTSASFSITKRNLLVTPKDNLGKAYDSFDITITTNDFTASNYVDSETPAFNGSLKVNPINNFINKVGIYQIVQGDLSLDDNTQTGFKSTNYNLEFSTASKNYTITKKTLTLINIPAQEREYNKTTTFTPSGGTLNGVCLSDSVGFTWKTVTFSSPDATTHSNTTVGVILTSSNEDHLNYTISDQSLDIVISKRKISIGMNGTLDDVYNYMYDDGINTIEKELIVLYKSTPDSVAASENSLIYTIQSITANFDSKHFSSLSEVKDIGSYNIALQIDTNYSQNYEFEASGIVEFIINALEIESIHFDNDAMEIIYDGLSHGLTYGQLDADIYVKLTTTGDTKYYPALELIYTYTPLNKYNATPDINFSNLSELDKQKITEPGLYTVTWGLADGAPYSISGSNLTSSFTFSITYLTMTDDNVIFAKETDKQIILGFNYADQKPNVYVDSSKYPLLASSDFSTNGYQFKLNNSPVSDIINAATYTVKTTILNKYYYDIEVTRSVVINPLPINVNWSNITQKVLIENNLPVERSIGIEFYHNGNSYETNLNAASYTFTLIYSKFGGSIYEKACSYNGSTFAIGGVTDIGSYSVFVSISGNYSIGYNGTIFNITKRTILTDNTLSISDSSFKYDRSSKSLTVDATKLSAITSQYGYLPLSYSYSRLSDDHQYIDIDYYPVDAGTYKVIVSISENDYFNEASSFLEASLTINKANATITNKPSVTSKTYNHLEFEPTYTITDEYSNSDLSYSLVLKNGAKDVDSLINIGEYTIIVSLTKEFNANYTLTGDYSFSYIINPMPLDIIITNDNTVYNKETQQIEYYAYSQTLESTNYLGTEYLTYVLAKYRLKNSTADFSTSIINPGIYEVAFSTNVGSNYIIVPQDETILFTINKRTYDLNQMTFAGSNANTINSTTIERDYNRYAHNLLLSFNASYKEEATKYGLTDIIGSPIVTYVRLDSNKQSLLTIINAGTYTYSATLSNTYYETAVISVTLVVKPAVINITGNSSTTYTGDPLDPMYTYSLENNTPLPADCEITITYEYSLDGNQYESFDADKIDSGYYQATLTSLNSNYVFANTEATTKKIFTINAQDLTVSPKGSYSNIPFDGNEKSIDFEFVFYSAKYPSNDPNIKYTSLYEIWNGSEFELISQCKDPGSYRLTITVTNTKNYTGGGILNLTILTNTFTVSLVQTKTYTGSALKPSVILNNLASDVVEASTITITKVDANDAINIGEYYFNIKIEHEYYQSYEENNVKLTILPAVVSAKLNEYNAVYDVDDSFKPKAIFDQILDLTVADTDYSIFYQTIQETIITDPVNAGKYYAVITLINTNLKFNDGSSVNLAFEITKRSLTVSKTTMPESVYYDGSAKPIERSHFEFEGANYLADLSSVGYNITYSSTSLINSQDPPYEIDDYKVTIKIVDANYTGEGVFDFSIIAKLFGNITFVEVEVNATHEVDYTGHDVKINVDYSSITDEHGEPVNDTQISMKYISSLTNLETSNTSNAGTYFVTATISALNYKNKTISATIVVKHVLAKLKLPDSNSFVYNESNIFPYIEATDGNSEIGISVKYERFVSNTYITTSDSKFVGGYRALVQPINTNYSLGTDYNGISYYYYYNITPMPLNIIADSKSLTAYYDGKTKSVNYTMKNLAGVDYFTATTIEYKSENNAIVDSILDIGKYYVKITVNDPSFTGSAQFEMQILPRQITKITFDERDFIYDGSAKTVAVDYTSLPSDYIFDIEYTYYVNGAHVPEPVNAGQYTVVATITNPYFETFTQEQHFAISKNVLSPTVTTVGDKLVIDYIEGALYSVNNSEFTEANTFEAVSGKVIIKIKLPDAMIENYLSTYAEIEYNTEKSFSYITLAVIIGSGLVLLVCVTLIANSISRRRKFS